MKQALYSVCLVAMLVAGCARVYVPPAIDLKPHETIGLITFKSESKGDLTDFLTQKFIESITVDQKEIGIVELGDEDTVLAAVGQTSLGPDAYKAIGTKYNVKTIFTGELNVSDVKPSIFIGPGLSFASLSAKVSATLTAKLIQTSNGATLWTKSGKGEHTVGGVTKSGSYFSFSAEDPEESYGELARDLTHKLTRDFRHSWRCKSCGKR